MIEELSEIECMDELVRKLDDSINADLTLRNFIDDIITNQKLIMSSDSGEIRLIGQEYVDEIIRICKTVPYEQLPFYLGNGILIDLIIKARLEKGE